MARTSFADRVVAHITTDPILDILGHQAKGLLLDLLMLMARLGGVDDPHIGVGSGYPIGSRTELAFALRIRGTEAETQLETQLAALIARGCLKRDPDGVLRPPAALRPTRRQLAARANGAKGGRPRSLKEPTEQCRMLFAIPGRDRARTSSVNPSGSLAKTSSSREEIKLASVSSQDRPTASDLDVHRIATAALGLAEIGGEPSLADRRSVARWLAAGVPETALLDIVRRQSVRMRERGSSPRHLGAFRNAIVEAAHTQPEARCGVETEARRRWSEDMEGWKRHCREVGYQPAHMRAMPDLQAYLAHARAA